MDELLKHIPDGFITFLGWLTLLGIIVFKEKLWAVLKVKPAHNPNFQTLDKKLDDIKLLLVKLTTIIDERLEK